MPSAMLRSLLWAATFAATQALAQTYTSYLTGNAGDAQTTPQFGIVLMGGAGEQDDAMRWFLQRAQGGDVVVLRTSGSNGYNNYLYSQLGIAVDSVETLVLHNAAAASHPYVLQRVQQAEAVWIAGGNQANYVSEWRGTPLAQALNDLLLQRHGVVGGISAGMAVLGESYFAALNGTITSATALGNPFHANMTLGHADFVRAPWLAQTITDTHFDNPDRRGRLAAFLARIHVDRGVRPLGIACDEYAAVCIDETGLARCYGAAPQYDDYVWFVRPACTEPSGPEVCQPGLPLTWHRGGQALKAYRIAGTSTGNRTFDLTDWRTGTGGQWFHWSVQNGTFAQATGSAPACSIPTAPALATSFGHGCQGAGSMHTLTATALPWLGSVFRASGSGFATPALVVAGTGFQTLQLPLASVLPEAAGGCGLWVAPAILEAFVVASGTIEATLPLAANASLIGLAFYHQHVALELGPTLAVTGATSSNGLALTIGAP